MGWFDQVKTSEFLMQGDILFRCPVITPDQETDFEKLSDPAEIKVTVIYKDVIVLTQSCDLDQVRNKDTGEFIDPELNVIMCPLATLEEVSNKSQLGNLRTDKNISQHLLKISSGDYRIVDFSTVYTQPISVLSRWAASQTGERLRLRNPFLELLSQRFAIKSMRVAIDEVDRVDKFQLEEAWEQARKTGAAVG